MERDWPKLNNAADLPLFLEDHPHFPHVMKRVARAFGAESVLADEAYQEMLTRTLESLDKGERIANFWAWGKTITFRFLSEFRRKPTAKKELSRERRSYSLSPAEQSEIDESEDDLRAAVFLLSGEEKYLLHSLVYGAPSITEMADSLGTSEDTVRRRRERVLKKLGHLLKSDRQQLQEVRCPSIPICPPFARGVTFNSNGHNLSGNMLSAEPIPLSGGRLLVAFIVDRDCLKYLPPTVSRRRTNLIPIVLVPRLRPMFSLEGEWGWCLKDATDDDMHFERDQVDSPYRQSMNRITISEVWRQVANRNKYG